MVKSSFLRSEIREERKRCLGIRVMHELLTHEPLALESLEAVRKRERGLVDRTCSLCLSSESLVLKNLFPVRDHFGAEPSLRKP